MTDAAKQCPDCGAVMRITGVRRTGGLIERYRTCECGRSDRALYRPEVFVSARIICPRIDKSSTTTATQSRE